MIVLRLGHKEQGTICADALVASAGMNILESKAQKLWQNSKKNRHLSMYMKLMSSRNHIRETHILTPPCHENTKHKRWRHPSQQGRSIAGRPSTEGRC